MRNCFQISFIFNLRRYIMAMQAALIAAEYRLDFEQCGEGSARRIRILHTYAK